VPTLQGGQQHGMQLRGAWQYGLCSYEVHGNMARAAARHVAMCVAIRPMWLQGAWQHGMCGCEGGDMAHTTMRHVVM